MSDFTRQDLYFEQLCAFYNSDRTSEIERYLSIWSAGTYISPAHSVLDHAERKDTDPLQYLRQAYNFNRKRAKRVPPQGYRFDGSAVYRKEDQYMIVRPDQYGVEKVVSFGSREE